MKGYVKKKILKMCKFDHNVKLRCLDHNDVCMGSTKDQWVLKEFFKSGMGEKKKTLHIGSLMDIIEFIMKLPSLVTLMSSIVCIDSCRVKITFIRSVNKA